MAEREKSMKPTASATKYHILTLNQISSHGLHRFPGARYTVGKAVEQPDAILVRSHDMHAMAIPATVKAIGRAGAGTNNIPVAEMSKRGVPVFNAPGANANVPNMLGQISTTMARAGLNIHNMVNKSRGEMAYTLVDVDSPVAAAVIEAISAIDGVLSVRSIQDSESP